MTRRTYVIFVTAIAAVILTLSAVAKSRRGSDKPPASEFGAGPRISAHGLYVVTLQGATDLKPRKMHTLQAIVLDNQTGQPIPDATIAVGGGMPQHGHGFPTRPRVTKNLENGWYEVSGVRFNMGGWWELKLTITSPAGTDVVTFNLAL